MHSVRKRKFFFKAPDPPTLIFEANCFKNVLEDIGPFYGATDTPVLDFWWCLPWVDRSLACFLTCMLFVRFTSSVTPADLLMSSIAGSHVPYMHFSVGRMLGIQWETLLLNKHMYRPLGHRDRRSQSDILPKNFPKGQGKEIMYSVFGRREWGFWHNLTYWIIQLVFHRLCASLKICCCWTRIIWLVAGKWRWTNHIFVIFFHPFWLVKLHSGW